MSFAGDVGKWTAKVRTETDAQHRKVLFEMARRVIARSPVDTGRFRNNWQISTGSVPQAPEVDGVDPTGAGAVAAVLSSLRDVRVGGITWIANGLAYARPLEYGWSKQAPAGMIRLTAAEFSSIVAAA